MIECAYCGKQFEEDKMSYVHGRLVCVDCERNEKEEEYLDRQW